MDPVATSPLSQRSYRRQRRIGEQPLEGDGEWGPGGGEPRILAAYNGETARGNRTLMAGGVHPVAVLNSLADDSRSLMDQLELLQPGVARTRPAHDRLADV